MDRLLMHLTDSQRWMVLAGVVLVLWLILQLSPILLPFLAGFGIAYLGAPMVDYIERNKRPRLLAVILVFLLFQLTFILLLLIFLPILEQQISALFRRIPEWLEWFRQRIMPSLLNLMDLPPDADPFENLTAVLGQHWKTAGGLLSGLAGYVSQSGLNLLTWLVNLSLIPVIAFYFLVDWHAFIARLRALIPRSIEPTLVGLIRECDDVLSQFLRGQLLVMLALSILYVVGLWLIGLEFALLLGLISGMVSFVPYLGFIVGILASGTAAAMQFQEVLPVVRVLGVFGLGQVLETVWLTPMLVGDKIGLHPIAVIFAILAGGQLVGFVG
ncbi:MAG: AI-2E family transporter, partial [Pseudomonadota bacterium]